MISKSEARRLRRLLRRRIAQFEQRLRQAEDAAPPAAELEREARALLALMKALDSAAEMERQADAAHEDTPDPHAFDADLRRRLARQLEALCAKTGRARPGRSP